MDGVTAFRGLDRGARWGLIGGSLLLVAALASPSVPLILLALAVLIRPALALNAARRTIGSDKPWPWPADFRSLAEGLARPLDPTPKRLIPPDDKAAMIAQVATTKEALSRLIADKPPAWPWAVFTSVLVQRRNAVGDRLRRCASGYQPRTGTSPLSGLAYTQTAIGAMNGVADLVTQTEQFMLSPAFKGAFGDSGADTSADADADADADAIVAIGNRLMDYHEAFLTQAETCLQTPVTSEVLPFVQDMGAFTLCPVLAFEQFIPTMCARVAEAQELLPYTRGDQVIALDDATLVMALPDGLTDSITAHTRRFTQAA
jgi:hypothetical protein